MNKTTKRDNTHCCVPQCFSRGSKNPYLSFHLFPDEKSKVLVTCSDGSKTLASRKAEWIRILQIEKAVSNRMTVCSKHFAPEDYSLISSIHQRGRLKPYAVPSRFLPELSTDSAQSYLQKNNTVKTEFYYEEIDKKIENDISTSSVSDDTISILKKEESIEYYERIAVEALLRMSALKNSRQ